MLEYFIVATLFFYSREDSEKFKYDSRNEEREERRGSKEWQIASYLSSNLMPVEAKEG